MILGRDTARRVVGWDMALWIGGVRYMEEEYAERIWDWD